MPLQNAIGQIVGPVLVIMAEDKKMLVNEDYPDTIKKTLFR